MRLCLGEIRPVDLEDTLREDTLYCSDNRRRPVWLQELEGGDFSELVGHVRSVLRDMMPTTAGVILPGRSYDLVGDDQLEDGDVILYICYHTDAIGRRVYLCVMGGEEGVDKAVFDRLDRMTVRS